MKFSIRDLLLATVIVALAVGWWADRRRLAKSIDELNEKLVRWSEYKGGVSNLHTSQ